MSGNESFIARWSRRKRGAAAGDAGAPDRNDEARLEEAASRAPSESAPLPGLGSCQKESPVVQDLPPLESINAESDIRCFLGARVPENLARAALRRAWTSDPAIREFVGLSENSWDFNAESSVPGFGPLRAEEAASLLGQLIGQREAAPEAEAAETSRVVIPLEPKAEQPVPASGAASAEPPASAVGCASQDLDVGGGASGSPIVREDDSSAALELAEGEGEGEGEACLYTRRHGRALPRRFTP